MGYRIQYGEKVTKEFISESKHIQKIKTRLVCILIICFATIFAFSKYKESLINFFLPGNKDVTRTAIAAFADDLRQGESVKDAAVAFCREIIDNANIQD